MSVNRDAFDVLAGIRPDGTIEDDGWFTDFIVVDNTGVSGDPPSPRSEVTVRGKGSGRRAQDLYDTRNDEMREIVPTIAASITADSSGDKITDDTFASLLRTGKISPEKGLELLKSNRVLVYPSRDSEIDRATADWQDIEDIGAGASSIHASLRSAGGVKFADAYSEEIARLRSEGHILTFK